MIKIICIFTAAVTLIGGRIFAHDNETIHPLLTDKAWTAWGKGGDILDNYGLSASASLVFTDSNNHTIAQTPQKWFRQGSIDEDAPLFRCFGHFYNPLSDHHGLTDPGDLGSPGSFDWMAYGDAYTANWLSLLGPAHVNINQESWMKARYYYMQALTGCDNDTRKQYFAHLFYSLGKICHLLQDLSQPDHVRNDAHVINAGIQARWIENYGANNTNGGSHIENWSELTGVTPLDWRGAGFKRVQDFWDRHMYNGSSVSPLDEDASGADPKKTLGLAEFINGNFLGEDASYAELTVNDSKHHFNHPSLSDTDYSSFGFIGSETLQTTWTNGGNTVTKPSLYLSKMRAGITIEKHAMVNYSLFFPRQYGVAPVKTGPSITISPPAVLEEYHKIILPKAIAYSAGLLDYFFRGQLYAYSSYDEQTQSYQVSVYNASGLPLNGGAFTIYWDDADGNRTAYTGVTSTYNAAEGLSVYDWVDFTIPVPDSGAVVDATKAMIVFQGTVGNTGDDPDDEGKAIAAIQLDMPPIPVPQPEIWAATTNAGLGKCGFINPAEANTIPRPNYLIKKFCFGDLQRTTTIAVDGKGEGASTDKDDCSDGCMPGFNDGVTNLRYRIKKTETTNYPSYDRKGTCSDGAGDEPGTESGYYHSIATEKWQCSGGLPVIITTYSGESNNTDEYYTCAGYTPVHTATVVCDLTQNEDGSWSGNVTATVYDGDGGTTYVPEENVLYACASLVGGTTVVTYSDPLPEPTDEYSSLYSTSDLKVKTVQKLFDYPELVSVGSTGFWPAASCMLTPDELNYSISRSKYQFHFKAPLLGSAKSYRISWVERTLPPLGGAITSLEIITNGIYRPGVTAAASGSGGIAKLQAIMAADGSVASVTILDPGSGYTSAPIVTFDSSFGSASRATATAVVDSNLTSATYGQVTSITLTSGGNYLPSVSVSNPGSPGTQATATCTLNPDGTLAMVTLSSGGSGYMGSPTVSIIRQAGAGGAVILPHLGTETAKTWTWGGNKPSGYTIADDTTWPVSPVFQLLEPSTNGTTKVANVLGTITGGP